MVWLLVFLVLALWAPGFGVLFAAGLRPLPAVIVAPAVSTAIAGGGAVIVGWLGIGWSPWVFAAVSVLAILLALASRGAFGPARYAPKMDGNVRSNVLLGVGVLLGAAIQLGAIVPGIRNLGMPVQNRDAVFHMNAVQAILDTGDASTFGGLAPMYGSGASPIYPAGWHGIVALVGGSLTVVETSNLLAVLVSVVIYPSGMALLARSLTSPSSWAGPLAPVVASGATVFPPLSCSFMASGLLGCL